MEILIPILGIVGFALSIMIHEISHGLMAERLGDPTARLMGRITFNPIPHIDLLGSIILPFSLFVLHSPILFGWAKPVTIDPYNLRNPKRDLALIALAGPLSNIVIAIILSISLRILLTLSSGTGMFAVFYYLIAINITIAFFNLLPVKILDGGSILSGFLPHKGGAAFDSFMNRLGYLPVLFLILPIFGGYSLASIIISPIINFFLSILIPSFSSI